MTQAEKDATRRLMLATKLQSIWAVATGKKAALEASSPWWPASGFDANAYALLRTLIEDIIGDDPETLGYEAALRALSTMPLATLERGYRLMGDRFSGAIRARPELRQRGTLETRDALAEVLNAVRESFLGTLWEVLRPILPYAAAGLGAYLLATNWGKKK